MEYYKKTEDLGYAIATTIAIVNKNQTTILRTNNLNESQIEMNHLEGRHLGDGYAPVDTNEALQILGTVHLFTGELIHEAIAPEKTDRPSVES